MPDLDSFARIPTGPRSRPQDTVRNLSAKGFDASAVGSLLRLSMGGEPIGYDDLIVDRLHVGSRGDDASCSMDAPCTFPSTNGSPDPLSVDEPHTFPLMDGAADMRAKKILSDVQAAVRPLLEACGCRPGGTATPLLHCTWTADSTPKWSVVGYSPFHAPDHGAFVRMREAIFAAAAEASSGTTEEDGLVSVQTTGWDGWIECMERGALPIGLHRRTFLLLGSLCPSDALNRLRLSEDTGGGLAQRLSEAGAGLSEDEERIVALSGDRSGFEGSAHERLELECALDRRLLRGGIPKPDLQAPLYAAVLSRSAGIAVLSHVEIPTGRRSTGLLLGRRRFAACALPILSSTR